MNEEQVFVDIVALICEKCGLCFGTFSDGIPLDIDMRCECGSDSFQIVDGEINEYSV